MSGNSANPAELGTVVLTQTLKPYPSLLFTAVSFFRSLFSSCSSPDFSRPALKRMNKLNSFPER